MKRKRISVIVEYGYYFLIPIALVVILNVLEVYQEKMIDNLLIWFIITGLLIFILAIFIIRYLNKRNYKIEYDDSALFFLNKKILIKDITSLKMISNHFLGRYQLELEYIDSDNKYSKIRFFPRIFYRYLPELSNLIIMHNPNAKTQKIYKGLFVVEKYKSK